MAGYSWQADGAGAFALLELAHKKAAWVARHTEIIRFDGGASIDRSTLIEFRDDGFTGPVPDCNGRTPIPLLALKRWPALHVSVTHDGKPVPILLRQEEREVLAAGLAAEAVTASAEAAATYAATHHLSLTQVESDLRAEILHEVEPDLTDRPAHLDVRPSIIEAIPNLAQMCAIYLDARIVVSLPATEDVVGKHICLVERHAERVDLRQGSLSAAYDVWTNQSDPDRSLRARWVNASPDASRRSLIHSDGSAMRIESFVGAEADAEFRKLWSWPFWVPDTYMVDLKVASFMECDSFHFEAAVPPGCYFDRAEFRLLSTGDDPQGPWGEMVIVDDDDHHPDRTHIHFTAKLSARRARVEQYDPDSKVRLVLRPTYHDGLRAGMHLSWLSTTLLLFLAATVGWSAAGWTPVVHLVALGQADANSLVALLLLGPTFALTIAARPDEHPLTKRIHSHYRARLLTTAVVVFTSSLAVAIDIKGAGLFLVLAGAAAVSAALAIVTGISALYSRHRILGMEDLSDAGTVTLGPPG